MEPQAGTRPGWPAALVVALVIGLGPATRVSAQPAAAEGASSSQPVAPAASAEGRDSLAGLIDALQARDRLNQEVDRAMERAGALLPLEAEVDAVEAQFAELSRRAGAHSMTTAGQRQLIDVDSSLRGASEKMDSLVLPLRGGTLELELLLKQLRTEALRWSGRLAQAQTLETPDELRKRMKLAEAELAEQIQRLRPRRDQLLALLDRATLLRSRMATLHNELVAQRQRIAEGLRRVEQEPLWRLFGSARLESAAIDIERRLRIESVEAYLALHGVRLVVIGLLAGVGSALALKRSREPLNADPAAERMPLRHTLLVMERPWWAALLLGVAAVAVMAPPGPVAFYEAGWLLMPVAAAVLALQVLGRGMRTLVWALVVAVLLFPFRSVLELDPLSDRIKTIFQLLVLVVALSWELARGYLPRSFPPRMRNALRLAGLAILVALLVAVHATVVGHVGLARTLRNGILGSLGMALIAMALYYALHGLGLGLLRTRTARLLMIVQRRRAMLDRALDIGLRWLAVLVVAGSMVVSFGFADLLIAWAEGLRTARFNVGEASVSIGAVLVALWILVGTYVVVVLLGLLLEDELLPRLRLKPGVPVAVSALARYTVAVIGFLFAMAAAGIDLGKVTLLAGAIGVGVGFGLQSVVNNFICGLILLVERPILVGDVVETETVSGKVRRIGIRASTIRTSQGADVIVPNGDLLSKRVTNWTARDRNRRIDIEVRVAHGSDPKQVVELLQKTAAAHGGVKTHPPPQALFDGFGDSALQFRLMAWVLELDDAGTVASELRAGILEAFGSSGVQIR